MSGAEFGKTRKAEWAQGGGLSAEPDSGAKFYIHSRILDSTLFVKKSNWVWQTEIQRWTRSFN